VARFEPKKVAHIDRNHWHISNRFIHEGQFSAYNDNFARNTLENIDSYGHTDDEKNDLLKLYSYKNSLLSGLIFPKWQEGIIGLIV
jgi:hypothetical protein